MFNDFKPDRATTSHSTSNQSQEALQRRRFPRLFLAHKENQLNPLSGVLLVLPDRSYLPVLALSSAGIMISPTGILGKIRLGQVMDCKLKISRQPLPQTLLVRLKVIRLTATSASLVIDALNFDDRLKLDQQDRDELIFRNVRQQDSSILPPNFRDGKWWNAPFDTNFLIWKDKAEVSLLFTKAIIEYDGVILTLESDQNPDPQKWNWWLRRSIPTVDEARGYASPWMDPESQKISMGASWRARLIRLLQSSITTPELQDFIEILAQV